MTAEELFAKIGYGHENAIEISSTHEANRKFRALVAEANTKGDCIINTGDGYYRPDFEDEIDVAELKHYLASELHRARAILYKRMMMKKAYGRMDKDISEHVRQSGS